MVRGVPGCKVPQKHHVEALESTCSVAFTNSKGRRVQVSPFTCQEMRLKLTFPTEQRTLAGRDVWR